jgi:hypothetical protein
VADLERLAKDFPMLSFRSLCFLSLSVTFAGYSQPLARPGDIYDGFEEAKLSALWRTEKLADGAVEIQSAIVRAGRSALKVTIHAGDRLSPADSPDNKSSKTNERDELQEAKHLLSREGEAWAYSFSLYVPKDFPLVPTRLVLAQWKHQNDHDTAVVNSPVLALRYEEGILSVSTQTGLKKITRFQTKDDIRGRWVDLIFHVRFSRKEDGIVRVWMDAKPVVSFQGQTAYAEPQGYPKESIMFFFKMGLYRDSMPEPMTVFFDEYRKRPLSRAEQQSEPNQTSEPTAPSGRGSP